MKISCLQENLIKGLSRVQRAVANRTTLPITQNVLLETEQGRIKLVATNLEIAITSWIPARIDEPGLITVPARLFTDLVNSLPPSQIDIESTEEPLGINIKTGEVDSQLNGLDPSEFPPIPSVDDGIVCELESQFLKTAIDHVAFAAATEESRPVLTGIKVDVNKNNITFAAADGFRLAVYTGTLETEFDGVLDFVIPSRGLQEVNRLIESTEETVQLTITPSKSQAVFHLENAEVVTQLINGEFPPYQTLVPDKHETLAKINVSDFFSASKTASIFARDGSGILRLLFEPNTKDDKGNFTITSKSDEVGESTNTISADIEGSKNQIAFNNKFLTDVLGILKQKDIELLVTSSSAPGLIRPIGENESYKYVIMPMFVQW